MNEAIRRFRGDYRFLSNFYPSPVRMSGLEYPTVEHAFQAAKTLDGVTRVRIQHLPEPSMAKTMGRALQLRPGWDEMRLKVMRALIRAKFDRHPFLAERLLATGEVHLEEGNTWGDRFWGTVDDAGENHLGRILMEIRAELRAREG